MRFVATYGNELFRLIVVESAITAQAYVDQYIRMHHLCHEDGVLANHQRADARKQRIMIEIEIVGQDFVQYLHAQRFAALALFRQFLLYFPLSLVVLSANVDTYKDISFVPCDAIQRNGVCHTAVDEYHSVTVYGFIE